MKSTFLGRIFSRSSKTSTPEEDGASAKGYEWQAQKRGDDYTIKIDKSSQVILLDLEEEVFAQDLYPSLSSLAGHSAPSREIRFVSAALLSQKAKQFDDGLVAAIALAMQHGVPELQSKPDFLRDLLAELMEHETAELESAIVPLMAAGILGGGLARAPRQWRAKVDSVLADFFCDPLRSKPLGFYTWTNELTDVFRQDRMLQTQFEGKSLEVLYAALQRRADLRETYEKLVIIGERLTNYYACADLRISPSAGTGKKRAALFPACESPETMLLTRMFPPPTAVPEGLVLIDEIVRRIQTGELTLRPSPQSGWYEHQLWSLEPLLIPAKTSEAEHLQCSSSYQDHLVSLFKAAYALARETHVKDLRVPFCGMAGGYAEDPTIYVRPSLSIEPTATSYQRRALSYRFISRTLADLIGEKSLRQIHRVSERGPISMNLDEELRHMEALFWGAYLTSMDELGMLPTVDEGPQPQACDEDTCRRQFQEWKKNLLLDADVAKDSRMMVPVFHDLGRKKTKVWVFLGWERTWIKASFARDPKVEVYDRSGKECTRSVRFSQSIYDAATPVMHEVYVSELMDRDEFRAHCDKHRTVPAILKNLV